MIVSSVPRSATEPSSSLTHTMPVIPLRSRAWPPAAAPVVVVVVSSPWTTSPDRSPTPLSRSPQPVQGGGGQHEHGESTHEHRDYRRQPGGAGSVAPRSAIGHLGTLRWCSGSSPSPSTPHRWTPPSRPPSCAASPRARRHRPCGCSSRDARWRSGARTPPGRDTSERRRPCAPPGSLRSSGSPAAGRRCSTREPWPSPGRCRTAASTGRSPLDSRRSPPSWSTPSPASGSTPGSARLPGSTARERSR